MNLIKYWLLIFLLVQITQAYQDFKARGLQPTASQNNQNFQKKIDSIALKPWGRLFIKIAQTAGAADSITEFVNEEIEEKTEQLKYSKEVHTRKQTKLLKMQQQLQTQVTELQIRINDVKKIKEGVLTSEQNYYNNQFDHLKKQNKEDESKIETKTLQLEKIEAELLPKLNGHNEILETIDSVIQMITSLIEHPTKKGIGYIQTKGKVNKSVENMANTKVKSVKKDAPMLAMLVGMGTKSDFSDPKTANQIITMLGTLRNSVVSDINQLGGDLQEQAEKLKQDIQNLQDNITGRKGQIEQNSQATVINQEVQVDKDQNLKIWEDTLARLQEELDVVKEQQMRENNFAQQNEDNLKQELELFQDLSQFVKDDKFLSFLKK